ncbi:hypothetical protein N9N67_10445 [Bacteriovoracaceae bacterium]|nr:hypothetical protein [Bacteriovoracaceae bacterium]
MDVTLFRKTIIYFAVFAILIMMMTNFSYGNENTSVLTGVETELISDEVLDEVNITPELSDGDEETELIDDESIEI